MQFTREISGQDPEDGQAGSRDVDLEVARIIGLCLRERAVLEALASLQLARPRVGQDRHPPGRRAVGPLDMPGDRLARPQLDVLEEGSSAEFLILANHRQRVAETCLRGVVGVLDVQLDIQVALGDLLGRDRERVIPIRVGGVLGFLQDGVLVIPFQDRPPDRDRGSRDGLAGAEFFHLTSVVQRFHLRGLSFGLGLILWWGRRRIETQARDNGNYDRCRHRGSQAPDFPAMMFQRMMILDEHGDPPVQVRSPVADPQRRQGQLGLSRPRQADEVSGVVFG